MGNQLVNSMVRGFGMTLGRKAANHVTRPSQTKVVNEPAFTKKQLELINTFESIKSSVVKLLDEAETSYKNGKMTLTEYEIIKSEANGQIIEADDEIAKLKSIKQSSGSLWKATWGFIKWCIIITFVIGVLQGIFGK
jgi:hypothetical protein